MEITMGPFREDNIFLVLREGVEYTELWVGKWASEQVSMSRYQISELSLEE